MTTCYLNCSKSARRCPISWTVFLDSCKGGGFFCDSLEILRSKAYVTTDFYHIAEKPNSAVGLPEGLAEKLVRHTFFKWNPNSELELEDEEIAVISEEIVESKTGERADISQVSSTSDSSAIKDLKESKELPKQLHALPTPDTIFSASETYNGAALEHYCWSQSICDVDITILLPENVPSKEISVNILPSKITVKVKESILLEGKLCKNCKSKDSIWSMENKKLQIHLDKLKESWWDCLITTEEKMDLSKIDSSRPFEDLSEEVQTKIEELGWNQRRKQQGLPTSDELAKQEILKKAWSAEGSPFTGPFDPNSVNFM